VNVRDVQKGLKKFLRGKGFRKEEGGGSF